MPCAIGSHYRNSYMCFLSISPDKIHTTHEVFVLLLSNHTFDFRHTIPGVRCDSQCTPRAFRRRYGLAATGVSVFLVGRVFNGSFARACVFERERERERERFCNKLYLNHYILSALAQEPYCFVALI